MAWETVESSGVWKPKEPGEKLEGVLKSRETRVGQNGADYISFTIEEKETGEEKKVSGASLNDKLGSLDDGTKVLITFKGMGKTKKGNSFKDFAVQVWSDEPQL